MRHAIGKCGICTFTGLLFGLLVVAPQSLGAKQVYFVKMQNEFGVTPPVLPEEVIGYYSTVENMVPAFPELAFWVETVLETDIAGNVCRFFLPFLAEGEGSTAELPVPPTTSHTVTARIYQPSPAGEIVIAETTYVVSGGDILPLEQRSECNTSILVAGSTLGLRIWTENSLADNVYLAGTRALYPQIAFLDTRGDVNGDGVVALQDMVRSLQASAGTAPPETITTMGDVNGDGRIGTVEGLFILDAMTEDRCAIQFPQYCLNIESCSAIGGLWSEDQGECQFFGGNWAGFWHSDNTTINDSLFAVFEQNGTLVEGDVQYSGNLCHSNWSIEVSGAVFAESLFLASGPFACGENTGSLTLSQVAISDSEIQGQWVLTADTVPVDSGTFSLKRL